MPTFCKGVPTGALPGGLLKNPLRQALQGVKMPTMLPVRGDPEPRSTNDVLIDDKNLIGGPSAMARAKRANEAITSAGEFLTGRQLKNKDENGNSAFFESKLAEIGKGGLYENSAVIKDQLTKL